MTRQEEHYESIKQKVAKEIEEGQSHILLPSVLDKFRSLIVQAAILGFQDGADVVARRWIDPSIDDVRKLPFLTKLMIDGDRREERGENFKALLPHLEGLQREDYFAMYAIFFGTYRVGYCTGSQYVENYVNAPLPADYSE